jgi:membrane carboxypeptidase/penicillin-binding protein
VNVRILFRAMLGLALLCVLTVAAGSCWLYLYSGDIPNFAALDTFAPASPVTAAYACSPTTISAIPYGGLGQNLRNATRAAEGNDRALAWQIARRTVCDHRGKMLKRHLLEYKTFVLLRHRFSSEQLLAMYLNTAHFGDGLVGVESASRRYYGRSSSELDISQAAMIAGLLKAPGMYSPENHPDGARARRDAVITAMVKEDTITLVQGQAAMQSSVR